jgi:hypothetical protein
MSSDHMRSMLLLREDERFCRKEQAVPVDCLKNHQKTINYTVHYDRRS